MIRLIAFLGLVTTAEFGRSQVTIHRIASGATHGTERRLTADELAECTAAINAMRYRSGRLKPKPLSPASPEERP